LDVDEIEIKADRLLKVNRWADKTRQSFERHVAGNGWWWQQAQETSGKSRIDNELQYLL